MTAIFEHILTGVALGVGFYLGEALMAFFL